MEHEGNQVTSTSRELLRRIELLLCAPTSTSVSLAHDIVVEAINRPSAEPSAALAIGDHVEWQGNKGVVITSPAVVVQFFDKYGSKKASLSMPVRDLTSNASAARASHPGICERLGQLECDVLRIHGVDISDQTAEMIELYRTTDGASEPPGEIREALQNLYDTAHPLMIAEAKRTETGSPLTSVLVRTKDLAPFDRAMRAAAMALGNPWFADRAPLTKESAQVHVDSPEYARQLERASAAPLGSLQGFVCKCGQRILYGRKHLNCPADETGDAHG